MAAGLGFKTFAVGEILSAANVNGYLMQGVLVFASAAARDAAITSPQEGQFAYLKDTNVTTYYTGSAWANLDTTGMTNPMTTTGDTIYSSSGSTPARLGIGTANQQLRVNAGATAPEWFTPAAGGGGKILQVISGSYSTYTSTSSTTFVDINAALNLSLTCATTSSRVLVLAHFNECYVSVDTRDIKIGVTAAGSIIQKAEAVMLGSSGENILNQDLMIVHSPASASAVEYKMQFASRTGGAIELNQNSSTGGCTLTLMEIGA